MKNLNLRASLLVLMTLVAFQINAQDENIKLKTTGYELVVDVTPEKAWETLMNYGSIASFHAGLDSSESINGSPNDAELNSERICYIPRTKTKHIMVKERVIDFNEGENYTYDVYEWENFPLKKMSNTFGVKTNAKGKTVVYQVINFRLKPGFMTSMMKGKMKRSSRETLIGYKHYMETGEKRVAIKVLKRKYKAS